MFLSAKAKLYKMFSSYSHGATKKFFVAPHVSQLLAEKDNHQVTAMDQDQGLGATYGRDQGLGADHEQQGGHGAEYGHEAPAGSQYEQWNDERGRPPVKWAQEPEHPPPRCVVVAHAVSSFPPPPIANINMLGGVLDPMKENENPEEVDPASWGGGGRVS